MTVPEGAVQDSDTDEDDPDEEADTDECADAADEDDTDEGAEAAGTELAVDVAAADPGLLENLAPHRRFDRLARLEESGKARIHCLGKARLAPEQAIVAVGDQHDDGAAC